MFTSWSVIINSRLWTYLLPTSGWETDKMNVPHMELNAHLLRLKLESTVSFDLYQLTSA